METKNKPHQLYSQTDIKTKSDTKLSICFPCCDMHLILAVISLNFAFYLCMCMIVDNSELSFSFILLQFSRNTMAIPHDHESIEEIREALQNKNQIKAIAKIKEYLDRDNNTPLNIAITGESGSGKSSFVNAFRGIDNRADGAAPTGCVETTSVVTQYHHPNYPNVKLWDLPGVGTTKFPADQYLKLVGFERFDFFIIISATRFTENDVKLPQEIQKMKKKFYFVRSKIDNDLYLKRRIQRDFSETRTKELIKENCIQGK